MLSMVEKIYARIRESFIDDEPQEGFKAGRGCVNQIFILKQIGEKAQ